jgi:CRISPR-associated endonuclease/helicase Cas3
MAPLEFDTAFTALTGNAPFPWQRALYERFVSDRSDNIPASCNLPTGLGKTSVIAVWLIALANHPGRMPRRLVYVVNRRTVVDQTTNEVEQYARLLGHGRAPLVTVLIDLSETLRGLSADATGKPLAISTLRGQFADNREWSADPSRPAVICGTVDMIGSRLLFSGYGCGFKTRPLHAGFLGQDALIVHDEAHLEPAFQELLVAIEREQRQGRTPDFCPLRVMELTATSRAGAEKPFELTADDRSHPVVQQRINAKKALRRHQNRDEKKLAEEIATLALNYRDTEPGPAVLVFVRKVEDVEKGIKKLPAGTVEQLTGTLRGLERDGLVKKPIFQRFLPPSNRAEGVAPQPGTVYLVCTSAGEVGVNISADHLICDLSTFESMAQRFGRVNRFGDRTDTEIHVVHPTKFDEKDALYSRLKLTLGLLELLGGDASPSALSDLRDRAEKEGSAPEPASSDRVQALRDYVKANQNGDPRLGGFAPSPTILPVSDILFDAWALTSATRPLAKLELPGRPPVAEYLHGVEDEKQRETHVGWRAEVQPFARVGVAATQIGDLLDDYPLKPHELLRDATYRVQDELHELAQGQQELTVWVIDPDDTVRVLTLGDLVKKDDKKRYVENLSGRTVVLPPAAGGLTETGTLSGSARHDPERGYDVAGLLRPASGVPLVRLLVSVSEADQTYRLLAPALDIPADFSFSLDGEPERERLRHAFPEPFPAMRAAYRLDLRDPEDADGPVSYLLLKPEAHSKQLKSVPAWPSLERHLSGVQGFAGSVGARLRLSADVERAVRLAAGWHDLGKDRGVWQRGAGNVPKAEPVAKTLHGRPPENLNGFRHELASLIDVSFDPAYAATFAQQSEDCRELVLHLIATHHGRGRPHFPVKEASDPERPDTAAQSIVAEVPRRFARLQRKYGRWGLAYLESLLRAADALDSKRIEETPIGRPQPGGWPRPVPSKVVWSGSPTAPTPTITVNVDATNPGQFFACCGLLELADRLWPGAEGWFAMNDRKFVLETGGDLTELVRAVSTTELALLDEDDIYSGRLTIGKPFRPLTLDWWHELGGRSDSKDLKVWAGTMESYGIARAMQNAIRDAKFLDPNLFDVGVIAYDPVDPTKKKEPYYYDARRGPNAHSRDVGFSPNDLSLTTTAFPAVELLCLVGLQRCLPAKTDKSRFYDYFTWTEPLTPSVLPAAVSGMLSHVSARGYRFENWFRTGQRKHKAFRSAIPFFKKVSDE